MKEKTSFTFRLDEDEKAEMEAEAAALKRSVASYLRWLHARFARAKNNYDEGVG